RARGGLAAAAALLERSVVLTGEPARRGDRMLAAAAAHMEAGSYHLAARLFASADTAELDDLGRAPVDLLRARHALLGGDVRDGPQLLLQAATRLEHLDSNLATLTYLQALAAAMVMGSLGRHVDRRDVALAASRRPMPSARTTQDLLADGLSRHTLEGP